MANVADCSIDFTFEAKAAKGPDSNGEVTVWNSFGGESIQRFP